MDRIEETIWAKGLREKMNYTVAFYLHVDSGSLADDKADRLQIEIAASNVYRLLVNGVMKGYGPARAAHGYTRKDVYSLCRDPDDKGGMHIVVEVLAANINSFYTVNELPFFGAEVTELSEVAADAGQVVATASDFRAFEMIDRIAKVQRFSFQRTFAESYRMRICRSKFYNGDLTVFPECETEHVTGNKLISRNVGYPRFEKIGYTELIASGAVSIDMSKETWKDRSVSGISDKLLGYKYEELEDRLSDDASRFVFESVSGRSSEGKSDGSGIDEIISEKTFRRFAFGRTITGFIGLKIDVVEPAVVYLIWDEILNSDGEISFERNTTCNVLKYDLAAGSYDLLAFEPVSVQYVDVIVVKGEIQLDELSIATYENALTDGFRFLHEDKELEAIVEAAKNTLAQNAVDVLTDCPSRERAGWLCDSYFSGRAERLLTGENSVERNFLENYMLAPQLKEIPDGMIPMCYPADHYKGVYIPNWSMWYVLELRNYLNMTGDEALIEGSREKVYGLVEFFRKYLNEDGLLENLESWVFVEWSKCNDPSHIKGVNYPSNMLYAAMLEAVDELYEDKELLEQSALIRKRIVEQSFNGEFFEDNRVRVDGELELQRHLTETCQYYAFYFGTSSREEFPELFDRMVRDFGPARDDSSVFPEIARSNAIVGNYLRLELLLRYGYRQQVLEECKAFFGKMADMTGTLWEHSFESASLNHGFASIAAGYIMEALEPIRQP